MRKGSHHSQKTRQLLSVRTKQAMRKPSVRKRILKTAFKKGCVPWNKGIKGIHLSKDSEFKEGETFGENHPSWRGGVQTVANDCVYLWRDINVRKRRPRVVYEDAHGKIPKGFVIYHRDGNRYNDSLRNLVAISRAELLKINAREKFKAKVKK